MIKAQVDFENGRGIVIYEPARTSLAEIEDAVRRAGYHPKVLEQSPINGSDNEKVK